MDLDAPKKTVDFEPAKKLLMSNDTADITGVISRVRSLLTFDAAIRGVPIEAPNELMESAYRASFKLLKELQEKLISQNRSK